MEAGMSIDPLKLDASESEVTRRQAVGSILRAAVLAHPVGNQLLAMTSSPNTDAFRVELQPLLAAVRRVIDAMAYLGEPFSAAEVASIDAAANLADEARAVAQIQ